MSLRLSGQVASSALSVQKALSVRPLRQSCILMTKAAPSRPRRGFEPIAQVVPVVAAPAIAAKSDAAPATGENADDEKEAEGGVALLEIDED